MRPRFRSATACYERSGEKGKKMKHTIRPADQELFSFAGLWGTCPVKGEPQTCVTSMTTSPSPDLASIHNRMPVILGRDEHSVWIETGDRKLLQPYPGQMTADPSAPRE